MVNIIKSEDLTLDEIKSRIISLDSRFAQGEFRFVKHSYAYDSFMGPNQTEGLSEFTHLLTQRANSQSIYPDDYEELQSLPIVNYESGMYISEENDMIHLSNNRGAI